MCLNIRVYAFRYNVKGDKATEKIRKVCATDISDLTLFDLSVTHRNTCQSVHEAGGQGECTISITVSQTCETVLDICFTDI